MIFAISKHQSKGGCTVEGPEESILTGSAQAYTIFMPSSNLTARCPVFDQVLRSFISAEPDFEAVTRQ
jgi:hypothetical protein